jgi:hypothetical protein
MAQPRMTPRDIYDQKMGMGFPWSLGTVSLGDEHPAPDNFQLV